MKKLWMCLILGVAASLMTFASPQQADAAIRIGADVMWFPVSSETMTVDDVEIDNERSLGSYGFAGHLNLGFDIFSIGLKGNYSLHTFSNSDLNYNQIDINIMARSGLPFLSLAVVAEAGPSIATDFGGVGYNFFGGLEYDVLPLPLLDLNVGVGGQYVKLPVGLNDDTRDIESIRLVLFLGLDFSI